MLYCIDTNIISDIFKGNKEILLKLEENIKNNFCITSISLAEIFKGAYLSSKKEEALRLIEDFIKNTEILQLNNASCKIYGEKYLELKKQGRLTQDFDLLIGSIAIAHDVTLITKNKKHFENISDLKIIEW